MVADERLAKHLDLEIGDNVLFIRTSSFQDEIPIVIANSDFPAQRVPGLLDEFSGAISISKALKRVGVGSYSQQWVQISARMPTQKKPACPGCLLPRRSSSMKISIAPRAHRSNSVRTYYAPPGSTSLLTSLIFG
ncbi:UTRA domain-containing protein [Bradyrhizobium sp. 1.29L]